MERPKGPSIPPPLLPTTTRTMMTWTETPKVLAAAAMAALALLDDSRCHGVPRSGYSAAPTRTTPTAEMLADARSVAEAAKEKMTEMAAAAGAAPAGAVGAAAGSNLTARMAAQREAADAAIVPNTIPGCAEA